MLIPEIRDPTHNVKVEAVLVSPGLYFCLPKLCKGKANPLQAWTDPEGSRSLMLPDFKTFGT